MTKQKKLLLQQAICFHITHKSVSETNLTHSYLCKMTFGGCDERLHSHITLLHIQHTYIYVYIYGIHICL
jgi:hypothetical protein